MNSQSSPSFSRSSLFGLTNAVGVAALASALSYVPIGVAAEAGVVIALSLNATGAGKQVAQQVPPIPIGPSDVCHIVEATPLLDKTHYRAKSEYSLKTINKHPLILLETIKLDDGSLLKIEQRGCEDVYFKFQFEGKKTNNPAEQIKLAADALAKLKVASGTSFINVERLNELSSKIKAELVWNKNGFVVCMTSVSGSGECIDDVKVTVEPSGRVEFLYIERPDL
jgi:hypothetical protein